VVVANSFARAAERESERAARERVETAPVEESPG
jgi:hypothetical protein